MPGASITAGTKRRASEPVSQNGSPAASATNSASNSAAIASTSNSSQSPSNASGGNTAATMNGLGGSGSGGATTDVSKVSAAAVMKMKAEVYEKDRDNFLSKFEKPTQIYRYIRARMAERPIFLQRNLSYMKNRFSRSHKGREGFQMNQLLEKKLQREKEDKYRLTHVPSPRSGNLNGPINYYNIIFLGFTDGQIWLPDTKARIDVCLARVQNKKRKDGGGPIAKSFEKDVDIKVYSPSTPCSSYDIAIPHLQKCPVIAVPEEVCRIGTNGHTVKSLKLILRVSVPQAFLQTRNFPSSMSDQQSNHLNSRNSNSNNNNNDLEEPKAKRRRSAPTTKDRENFIYDGDTVNNGKLPGAASDTEDIVIYSGAMSLFENDVPGDSLRNIDLDLHLKRMTRGGHRISNQRIRREISWESFDEKFNKVVDQVKPAGKSAKLCVAIRTSELKPAQFVETPAPLLSSAMQRDDGADSNSSLAKLEKRKSVRVVYQFMYGSNPQQQTESRDDLKCPWCSINCMLLYSLMKHLKLCHPRFQFTYTPITNGAKIDVTVNDSYDGSYTGSAYDLVTQPPGEAFARNGPTKRTEVFSILVCRPKPIRQSLQEFFDCDENDVDQRRTYITGHNRLYHHTSTCLPIHPREIDVDSEGEPDPEWLRVKTTMMIDEFTDVNEGEKELMKLWNLHVMKYNYVGDCQIPLACKRFVEYHGKELIQKNLYRNLCLHLTNLFDFGLLTPHGVHTTIQLLHSQMKDSKLGPGLQETWKVAQVNNCHSRIM
ncbi:unnamed protein product [Orchesella dallaii]|uniref:Polycomb protein Suz12 n=1 Tax=Orchesella dallaii TaxID=48710 RepID=A0ABP1Q7R4_9HEXA